MSSDLEASSREATAPSSPVSPHPAPDTTTDQVEMNSQATVEETLESGVASVPEQVASPPPSDIETEKPSSPEKAADGGQEGGDGDQGILDQKAEEALSGSVSRLEQYDEIVLAHCVDILQLPQPADKVLLKADLIALIEAHLALHAKLTQKKPRKKPEPKKKVVGEDGEEVKEEKKPRKKREPKEATGEDGEVKEKKPRKKREPKAPASGEDGEVKEKNSRKRKASDDVDGDKAEKKQGVKKLTSYMVFGNERRPILREANPTLPMTEITKLFAAEWKQMTPEQKKAYPPQVVIVANTVDDKEKLVRSAIEKVLDGQDFTKLSAKDVRAAVVAEIGQDGADIPAVRFKELVMAVYSAIVAARPAQKAHKEEDRMEEDEDADETEDEDEE